MSTPKTLYSLRRDKESSYCAQGTSWLQAPAHCLREPVFRRKALGQRVLRLLCERLRGLGHEHKSSDRRKRLEPGQRRPDLRLPVRGRGPICPRRSGHTLTMVLHGFLATAPATAPSVSHRLTACRTSHTPLPLLWFTSLASAGSWLSSGPWVALHRGVGAPWLRTVRVARTGTRSRAGRDTFGF